jgi:transposase
LKRCKDREPLTRWRSSPELSDGGGGGWRTSCGLSPRPSSLACFAEVARRNEVSRGLLGNWRSQVRRGKLAGASVASFLPVQVVNEAAAPDPQPPLPHTPSLKAAPAGRIEITLPDGSHVQVDSTVSLTALRRVVTALRG